MLIIIEQLGVGILGIVMYNVFKFQKFLKTKEIKTKVFWEAFWIESKYTWIWSIIMLSLISVAVKILPQSSESIQTLTGLNIGTQLVSFFSLGLALCSLVDTKKKEMH